MKTTSVYRMGFLVGLTAEELLFLSDLKELKGYAKDLDIPNRSKMNKKVLAAAVVDSINRS